MTGMNRSITNYFFLGGTLNAALLLLKEVQLHSSDTSKRSTKPSQSAMTRIGEVST